MEREGGFVRWMNTRPSLNRGNWKMMGDERRGNRGVKNGEGVRWEC